MTHLYFRIYNSAIVRLIFVEVHSQLYRVQYMIYGAICHNHRNKPHRTSMLLGGRIVHMGICSVISLLAQGLVLYRLLI